MCIIHVIFFVVADIVIKTQEKMALNGYSTEAIKDREHSDETTHLNPNIPNVI